MRHELKKEAVKARRFLLKVLRAHLESRQELFERLPRWLLIVSGLIPMLAFVFTALGLAVIDVIVPRPLHRVLWRSARVPLDQSPRAVASHVL